MAHTTQGSTNTSTGSAFTATKVGTGLRAFVASDPLAPPRSDGSAVTAIANALYNTKAVYLQGASISPKQVHSFIAHIRQLILNGTFSHDAMRLLIDQPAMDYIGLMFHTSAVMSKNRVACWQTDWDVATVIEALEEVFPLQPGDRFVSTVDKWKEHIRLLRKSTKVDQANLAGLRRDLIQPLIQMKHEVGDIPEDKRSAFLKDIATCLTCSSNPNKQSRGNDEFHRHCYPQTPATYCIRHSISFSSTATR